MNEGYYTGRVSDERRSPWTIYTPGGHSLGTEGITYWFNTKREARLYLDEHDIGAEIAERERKERLRQAELDRTSRIHRHALYNEYWALRCAWDGIRSTIKRINKDAERPELELVAETLRDLAHDLDTVAAKARTLGHQRYAEIEQDVDTEMAREKDSING